MGISALVVGIVVAALALGGLRAITRINSNEGRTRRSIDLEHSRLP